MAVKEESSNQVTKKESSSGDFRKELVRYFRTGEQRTRQEIGSFRSVFQTYFKNQPNKYPFSIGERELKHDDELIDQLIVHHLQEYKKAVLTGFKKELNQLIEALALKLAVAHQKEADDQTFDFASQMIAFDKLAKVVPSQASTDLNDRRKTRLTKVLKRLKRGLASYADLDAILVRSMSSYATVGSSDQMKIITASRKQAFAEVQDSLTHNMKAFTRLMKAFHIAKLEVEDAYREDIHKDYFKQFSWYWLSNTEKELMQPVFLMLDCSYVRYHLDDLSQLISSNYPVKVMLLHPTLVNQPMEGVKWEDASHRVRQEISTFAISHRNVVLKQLTSADPARLSDSIRDWIACTRPTLIHLLMPDSKSDRDYQTTCAAVYGRYFPTITFDPRLDPLHGDQWSIVGNPTPEVCWPMVGELPKELGGEQPFTYADYKALSATKVDELMLIPNEYHGEELLDLHDYLEQPMHNRMGKVPFVWLSDAETNIIRAAVPYVWVVSCEERMEFWSFLQGILRKQVDVPAQLESTEEKVGATQADTKSVTNEQLEEIEKRALQTAATKLINELMNG